jgi:outer membrane protein OmpA-like peptidoglycan-associated protein/tetratricopeptide (TPR) repeat protein
MKNLSALLWLMLVIPFVARSQYDPSKVSKKAIQLYTKALDQARDDHFKEGIDLLQQAVRIDPEYEDAFLSMAGMYGELKNYQGAIDNYEKARSIDSAYFVDYNLPYSINLAGKGDFEAALAAVNLFLGIPNLNETSIKAAQYRKSCYQFAIDYAHNKNIADYKFEPRNLGDSINSDVSEYYPTITIDGKKLIFTRRVNNFNEDFYGSDWTGDHWTKARALVGNINTNMNEGAQNVSQDGQLLIFTGCNFPDGYGSCDLYISYLTPEGWSVAENLGSTVNTEFWESAPSLSPDKRDLYFSSNRPGGYGGNDIYVTHRLQNGRWSEPENLGPVINTAGDESAPFIHADNQTLYFTSGGHPGYGGDDLYMSRKGPDGKWTSPVNLGYPINTIENEGSLVVAADGKTAYYASDRADSRGGLDIYSFELRSDVRPARTLWVKGKVFDVKTKKGLPSSVELSDLSTGTLMSRVQTDETGNYLITLPIGKDYAFEVGRKGYLFFSENFPLSQKQPDSTYNIDIPLEPIEPNATVVLKNIFFDVNKYDLKPESQIELDRLVQLLKDNPGLAIQINGHTDNTGKPADNMSLSENRAKAVVHYLITKGINEKRLSSKGWGDTKPVADNKTEEGRALNRRTELKVISVN